MFGIKNPLDIAAIAKGAAAGVEHLVHEELAAIKTAEPEIEVIIKALDSDEVAALISQLTKGKVSPAQIKVAGDAVHAIEAAAASIHAKVAAAKA